MDEGRKVQGSADCDLKKRTREFSLAVIRLYGSFPKTAVADVIGKQVLRSGTSVGAHYREAIRARSTAEFISKLEVGLQELEESLYWLELAGETGLGSPQCLCNIVAEVDALISIFVSSVRTAKGRK